MTLHPLDELPVLTEQLGLLEEVIARETECIEACDFRALEQVMREKQALLPALSRASMLLKLVINAVPDLDLEEEPELYELAISLVSLIRAASANEQAIVAAMQATQFTIRTIVGALRDDKVVTTHARYTRQGVTVADTLRQVQGLANTEL